MMRQLPDGIYLAQKLATVVDGNDTRLVNSLQLKRFSASRNLIIDIDLTSRGSSPRSMVTVPI